MTTESQITERIKTYLRAQSFYVRKVYGGPMQKKGFPDLLAIRINSRPHFFEVKKPGEKATKLQDKVLRELRKHGAVAECVSSLEEVIEAIEKC